MQIKIYKSIQIFVTINIYFDYSSNPYVSLTLGKKITVLENNSFFIALVTLLLVNDPQLRIVYNQ